MLRASLTNAIDRPWTDMEPVRVGVVPPGRGTPDAFVTVERGGQPMLRIDAYAKSFPGPFREAIVWKSFAVLGCSDVVHLIDPESRLVQTIRCDGYFGHLYPTEHSLLVADASRLICIDQGGRPAWESAVLGIDGVVVDQVRDGVIFGQGEWDPPGGWKPFRLSLASGRSETH
jgi:hypothetical protein